MQDKAKQISALLAPTVQALGLELLGGDYLPAPGSATLRLYLDVIEAQRDTREVNIDDCEKVSREVSAQLDVEDPISGNYTLEVSSPGIERPLFEAAHFARFIGQQAKAVLKLPQDGRRRVQGQILRVDGGNIAFAIEGVAGEFVVVIDNIEKAKLVPDWVALGLAPQPKNTPSKGKPSAGKPANKQPKQPAAKKTASKVRQT
jgi:ribosome maturation factor RimP